MLLDAYNYFVNSVFPTPSGVAPDPAIDCRNYIVVYVTDGHDECSSDPCVGGTTGLGASGDLGQVALPESVAGSRTAAHAADPSVRVTGIPVFVVGLPRSGTTLVEQILASHPQVYGAGELRLASESFEAISAAAGRSEHPLQCVPALDAQSIAHLAQHHLDKLNAFGGARAALAAEPAIERIVDKMPENYLFLGLLAAMFPHATLIHCRRDWRG